jgi:chemotaxis protein MotB
MRGGFLVLGVGSALLMATSSGCVSLDKYNRLNAAHRNVTAEKESVAQELLDERHVNDSLRTRVDSCTRELQTKNELLANLRGENDLLDEMRRNAVGQLEGLANRPLSSINIPKLPAALDTALKAFAEQYPNQVVYDPARGTVKWAGDLLFPLGSDVVKESSMGALQSFVNILKSAAAADFEVVVIGHTDNKPIQKSTTKEKHPTNWHLSSHRSIAVSNAIQKFGYAPNRVAVVGCAEFRPIAENSSESGASQNRRVDIYIVPIGTIAAGGAEARRTLPEEPEGAPVRRTP